jgi:hypothetical protein
VLQVRANIGEFLIHHRIAKLKRRQAAAWRAMPGIAGRRRSYAKCKQQRRVTIKKPARLAHGGFKLE